MTAVLEATIAEASAAPASAPRGAWLRERGMGATVLVAAISSAFGVVLIATGYIAALMRADPFVGGSDTLALVLGILAFVLVALAAVGISAAGRMLGVGDVPHTLFEPALVLPPLVVALTTWAAAWAGSRAVLSVTPLQALSGSVPPTHAETVGRSGRNTVALLMVVLGTVLLTGGILVGLLSPVGVLIAFVGGIFSFTGFVLGAVRFMPPVLRLIGRRFGRSATAQLAAQNALRHPGRSSRMAIVVVMGVTLVTMFAVAFETMKSVMTASAGGEIPPELATVLDSVSAIMMALVGVSAVIAAVGMVNLLTIGVVQRRRELGLLRALGVSKSQIRRMVLLEAAHIAIAALATGLVLGTIYGWAGAQSLLGSVSLDPDGGRTPTMVWPALPFVPLAVIVLATAALTLVATVVPTRLATRVAPIEALAAD